MPTTIKVAPQDKLEFDRLQAELGVRRGRALRQEEAFAEAVQALRDRLDRGHPLTTKPVAARGVPAKDWRRFEAALARGARPAVDPGVGLARDIDHYVYGGPRDRARHRSTRRGKRPA